MNLWQTQFVCSWEAISYKSRIETAMLLSDTLGAGHVYQALHTCIGFCSTRVGSCAK